MLRKDEIKLRGELKDLSFRKMKIDSLGKLKLESDRWILTEMINTGSYVFQTLCHDVFEEILILSKVDFSIPTDQEGFGFWWFCHTIVLGI